MNRSDIQLINKKLGTNFPLNGNILGELERTKVAMALDADYVAGANITAANGGVPALLTNWVDPALIEVLVAPMKMAQVFGEVLKGSRTTSSVMIPVVEANGETSTYGDFNENGMSGANVNYVSRQPYAYQTNIQIGEIEQEIAAEARVDWVQQHQQAAILTLNKFQNQTYVYGVAGLKNYGMLNDPDLLPSMTGINWADATAEEIFADVQKQYALLVKQGNGLVERDDAMTFVMSPAMDANLTKTNQYGLNVYDLIKKNFPNLKIETVPEYSTASGEVLQLILDSYNGRKTAEMAFCDKMRAHPVIQGQSGWKQKRSQSTLGAIIYYPVFVASSLASNTPA